MGDANVRAVITAEDKASGVLKGFGDNVNSIGNKIDSIVRTTAVGLLAVSAAAVTFGVASVKAFSESQDLIAQTNAVLASTGSVAGVTADKVTELATAWEKQTKFSDEAIRGAENVLLTFTAIGKDKFPQATEAVLNLATAMHEDLQSASVQVGKALQDPILGITALRRVGVNFNDAQKKVVEGLVQTGRQAEAQALILKELQTEFGGSAVAAGDTFSGSLEKLKNQFNNVQESIGLTIVKGLTPLTQKFADFVASDKFQVWLKNATDWLNKNLPIAADYVINTLLPALKKGFDDIWPVIKDVLKWSGDLLDFLNDHRWVVWALVDAFAAIKVAMFLNGAIEAFTAVMDSAKLIGSATAETISTAWEVMQGIIASPVAMGAITVVAALAAIALVYKAVMDVRQAINDVNNAAVSASAEGDSYDAASKRVLADYKAGKISKEAYQHYFLATAPGRASGGPVSGGSTYVVGEEGPELFTPKQSGSIVPNKAMGNSTVNINVNAGALMGTDVEARKFAQIIMSHLRDLASSKNQTVGQLMGY